ncbi:protein phosphatase 2C family protein [Wolffia australiana]
MGNSKSRVGGCFAPFGHGKEGVELDFLEPLDEGLGHSFCYVRPVIADSPAITPSNSERFTIDSTALDSDAFSDQTHHNPPLDEPPRPGKATFKTISGASVSANASAARTTTGSSPAGPPPAGDPLAAEPAASFDCTASFTAVPLQPAPRGSGPLDGFMSGPLEKGFLSGPLEPPDRANFSAPLYFSGRRPAALRRLAASGRRWVRRLFLHPAAAAAAAPPPASDNDYAAGEKLQWAHGKAGEDRVHVVLSEEQGWLFVGIYDGFSGPDAPEFLMRHLYRAVDRELQGLLWDLAEPPSSRSRRLFELLQFELAEEEEKKKKKTKKKKLFPWGYDWHRDSGAGGGAAEEPGGSVGERRCKAGPADHGAVLAALRRALEATERAFMEMVDRALDRTPELALMGSCVLVMLMKDQDVYAMNLGDSRVILAQDRAAPANPCLDRISEDSPALRRRSKNSELSLYRLKLRAKQLTTDHSTDVEEEVSRVRAEHDDDAEAVFNGRVKGHLKVTRAFGAGFLKSRKMNEALLEMFRVKYVGTGAYVSCSPSMLHHRLSPGDRFLVLSSDGLYQYFSNEEVVSHVAWFMDSVPDGDPAQYLITELLFRAAEKNGMDFHALLDIPHGDRRKYHDDVSVMVVSLEGRIWRSSG